MQWAYQHTKFRTSCNELSIKTFKTPITHAVGQQANKILIIKISKAPITHAMGLPGNKFLIIGSKPVNQL